MKIPFVSAFSRLLSAPALLVVMGTAASVVHAATITWDGGGVGGTALDTAANWVGDVLPTTSDVVLFDNSVITSGSYPANLLNSTTAQTWGSIIWSNSQSGVAITMAGSVASKVLALSGGGGSTAAIAAGGASGDIILLGSAFISGTFSINGTDGSGSSRLTLTLPNTTGNYNINVVNAGATLVFGSTTTGATAANTTITKTGAGTLSFTNGNVGFFTGAATGRKFILDQGTLNVTNNASLGGATLEIHSGTTLDNSSATGSLTLSANTQSWTGDFTFAGTGTGGLTVGNAATTSAITLSGSGSARTVTVSSATLAIGGVISGTGYGLTKAGAGTLQLLGASTYDGTTTVNGGTLQLVFTGTGSPTDNIINNSANSSDLKLSGGTLTLTGKASTTNSQRFNGVTVNAGASQFTSTIGTSGTVNSTLGTITRNTGGTLNVTLPATGTVGVSNSNDANGLLGAGMTVGANDWATVSGGNLAAFTGYTTQNAVGSWTANQNITNSAAFSGSLAANLAINSLRFNNSAATTVNLGTSTLTVLDGILITGTVSNQAQTISGGSIQGSSGGDLVVINNGGGTTALTISSNIVNNGSATAFTKSGAKTVTLSGANNTYTGATYVNAGTLAAGVATTAFGSNSAVVISTGATLNITGFSQTIGSLASNNATSGGTGAVTLGAATLTTGGDNTSTTFAGVISGTGGVIKTGSGTQTLSGVNTYTGATTVSAGTLALGASNRIADTSNLVMTGGIFFTGGFSETLGTLTFSGSASIDLGSGASALVFSDSSGATWGTSITLSFVNFTAGVDTIRIGTTAGGLTLAQLSEITINGASATIDSGGFLAAAIPEPSTYAAIFGALALVAVVIARRRRA